MEYDEIANVPGRVLWIGSHGELIVARKYGIYESRDRGKSFRLRWRVPVKGWKPIVGVTRVLNRLLRQEIRAFALLSDGSAVAVANDGVYRGGRDEVVMHRSHQPKDGRPLKLCVDTQDQVIFGDYGFAAVPKQIHVSRDGGETFEVAHEFPRGDILHVHGVQEDPYDGGYWVFVGDFGKQPGIARLSADFQQLDWVARGKQTYRVVEAIIEKDCLYYGMDTELEQNYIMRLDKRTGQFERLRSVEGSSLFASRLGGVSVISTCVERSAVNLSRSVIIYAQSIDGEWVRLAQHEKDRYGAGLFQFGTCIFPVTRHAGSWGAYSGQSLVGIDNRTLVIEWKHAVGEG